MQQSLTLDNHTMTVDNRRKASMTGVIGVDAFNDKQMQIRLSNCLVHVTGEGLTINKFNTENGTLVIDGKINEIKYNESGMKGAGVLKKIFQ